MNINNYTDYLEDTFSEEQVREELEKIERCDFCYENEPSYIWTINDKEITLCKECLKTTPIEEMLKDYVTETRRDSSKYKNTELMLKRIVKEYRME